MFVKVERFQEGSYVFNSTSSEFTGVGELKVDSLVDVAGTLYKVTGPINYYSWEDITYCRLKRVEAPNKGGIWNWFKLIRRQICW